jgi:hypothetical protein
MFGLKAFLAYFSRLSTGDAISHHPIPFYRPGEVKIRPSGGGKRDAQAGKEYLLLISQVAGYYTISQHLSKFLTSPTALNYSRKLLRSKDQITSLLRLNNNSAWCVVRII